MPMQIGKMTVESPQEVLARLRQERQVMGVQGGVQGLMQATTSNALDALFGNPEVKHATSIQTRLKSAAESAVPQEGDDDVTSEMRRVAAQRDAIQDLDPGLANEMTNQLLQLGSIKSQRAKLQAQTVLAQNRDTRGQAKLELDAAKTGMSMAKDDAILAEKAGAGQNYWKRVGGQIKHIAVPASESLQRRRLMAEGWVEGTGPTSEAEAESIVGAKPTKPVETDLQTALLNANNQLDQMATIAQKFEPSFLELPTQLLMKGAGTLDKLGLGGTIPADLAGRRERFVEFRRNSVNAFNLYIKSITGAAMAVPEAERIQKGFPDAEQDDPRQFVAKMRGTARDVLGIQKRAAQVLAQGIKLTPEQMALITVPPVSDDEVDTFLQKFGIPARSAAARSPSTGGGKPDASGWITTRRGSRVKEIK